MEETRNSFVENARFEHAFWLSVLRDHTDFIRQSLGPMEQAYILEANHLHGEALHLNEQVQGVSKGPSDEMRSFTQAAAEYTSRLLQFKQTLLDRQLACLITLHLPPSLVDHMIREGEEYLQVISQLLTGRYLSGAALAIHEANLWLPDASGHAALIRSNVDAQEAAVFESAHDWKLQFDKLYLHLLELQTKLRSQIRFVPSLQRLMALSHHNIAEFRKYLQHLEELVGECKLLGDLKPAFFDHMAREATYFLEKLERSQQG